MLTNADHTASATVYHPAVSQLDRVNSSKATLVAQISADDQANMLKDPGKWFQAFTAFPTAWTDWQTHQLVRPARADNLIDYALQSLQPSLTDPDEQKRTRRAVATLHTFVRDGYPHAEPFRSAERNLDETSISLAHVAPVDGVPELKATLLVLNATMRVADWGLWEDRTLRLQIQGVTWTARWNRQTHTIFDEKYDEFLASRRRKLLDSIPLD